MDCAGSTLPGLNAAARQDRCRVVEQVQLARDTWRVRIAAPELAREIVPGQFVMIRPAGSTAPLLGRPFALWDLYLDADGQPAGIDLVYLVVGRMTRLMPAWDAGDLVDVWGPLGNGFPVPDFEHLLLVGGGIGHTPFLAVAAEARGRRQYGRSDLRGRAICPDVRFLYGVRSAEYLAGVDEFRQTGIDVQIATDDGSAGQRGYVTDLLQTALRQIEQAGGRSAIARTGVFCCGPEPMLHAVAKLVRQWDVPAWISLETPMACGFGACFSCVTKVRQPDGEWDYRRVCVEGPIFPAADLVWE